MLLCIRSDHPIYHAVQNCLTIIGCRHQERKTEFSVFRILLKVFLWVKVKGVVLSELYLFIALSRRLNCIIVRLMLKPRAFLLKNASCCYRSCFICRLISIPPCRQTRISSADRIFTQSTSCRIVDSSHAVIVDALFSMISSACLMRGSVSLPVR